MAEVTADDGVLMGTLSDLHRNLSPWSKGVAAIAEHRERVERRTEERVRAESAMRIKELEAQIAGWESGERKLVGLRVEKEIEERVRAECQTIINQLESNVARLDAEVAALKAAMLEEACMILGETFIKDAKDPIGTLRRAVVSVTRKKPRDAELETDLRRMTKLQELTSQACSDYRREVESLKEQLADAERARDANVKVRVDEVNERDRRIAELESRSETMHVRAVAAEERARLSADRSQELESQLAATKPMLTADEELACAICAGFACDTPAGQVAFALRKYTTPYVAPKRLTDEEIADELATMLGVAYGSDEHDKAGRAVWDGLGPGGQEQLAQLLAGPTYDGDVIGKSQRDRLLRLKLAVRCCVGGEQGYTAASYAAYTVRKLGARGGR